MSDRYAHDRPAAEPVTLSPFQIRGRFLTALTLRVDTEDAGDAFYARLDEQLGKTPQFFAGAPMVLDFANAPGMAQTARLRSLVANLRRRNLRVFGVQNAEGVSEDALQEVGLIPVAMGRDAPEPQQERQPRNRAAPPPRAKPKAENKVIRHPVRSGQMVVAENGDLTVIGSVASGAELIASGNIHVYGPLRGRAMAGAHGDESARIFCRSLEAELVAIAGLYQTSETLEDHARERCAHIYLEDERLCMEVIA